HIDQMGQDVIELCQHFEPTFSTLAERTRPRDWYESLMKGFVFDGIMNDFYRTAVDELVEPGYSLAIAILDDTRASDYARNRLTAEVAEDTQLASRLALWGRKLVAETLGRARSLLTDPILGIDEDLVVEMIPSVTSNHSRRMSALGLVACADEAKRPGRHDRGAVSVRRGEIIAASDAARRSSGVEPDATDRFGADFDIAQRSGGNEDLTSLRVRERQQPFGLDLLLDACSQVLRVLVGFEGHLTLSLFDADLDFHGAPCRFSMADDDLACAQPNVSRQGLSSRSIPLWADAETEGMSSGRDSGLGGRTQHAPAHLGQQRHGGVVVAAALGSELFDDDLGGADESPAQKLGLVVFQRCEVLQGSDHTCGRPLPQIAQLLLGLRFVDVGVEDDDELFTVRDDEIEIGTIGGADLFVRIVRRAQRLGQTGVQVGGGGIDEREIQILLRIEMLVEHGLGHAGGLGDHV